MASYQVDDVLCGTQELEIVVFGQRADQRHLRGLREQLPAPPRHTAKVAAHYPEDVGIIMY